jgi:hypothetical protein
MSSPARGPVSFVASFFNVRAVQEAVATGVSASVEEVASKAATDAASASGTAAGLRTAMRPVPVVVKKAEVPLCFEKRRKS